MVLPFSEEGDLGRERRVDVTFTKGRRAPGGGPLAGPALAEMSHHLHPSTPIMAFIEEETEAQRG